MSNPKRNHALWTTALFLLLLHLSTTGCTTQQAAPPPPESVSASFSIRARDVESRSGVTALAFSYAEISRIVIDVKERDSGHVLLVNADLALSDGVWSGTLPFLPKGKTLTFSARALSDAQTPLFSGATDKLLAQDGEAVPITLAPVSNGQSIELPRIRKISIPTALESDQAGDVAFLVEATTQETLTYELSAAPGGGLFSPTIGLFTLTSLVGTFVIRYVPPQVTQETDFEHRVKVTNKAGHSVSSTFKTKVKPPGKTDGVADTVLKVLFNPVINSLSAYRQLGSSDVLFEAGITDDSPPEEWRYAWSFTPSDGTSPEPRPVFTSNTNPSTLQHYSASVRGEVTLAVTDAQGQGGTTTVRYVLQPDQFPDNPMADSGLLSLRAGEGHTCMLLSGGTVRCWGRNTWGQLGLGHASHVGDDELPDTVGNLPLGEKVEQLAVGGQHTCALLESGMVRCWGRNHAGQLGYGHTLGVGDDEAPSSAGFVNLGGRATRLVAGSAHTCALLETGEVRCWGLNAQGQLGYGHSRNVGDDESPASAGTVNVGGSVRELVAGASHTCALLETGEVRCWGLNAQGQLGYGHTRNVGDDEFPSGAGTVNVGGTVVQLATSSTSQHTCARLGTGPVRCWGLNTWGQLGYGHTRHVGDDESPASADVSVGGPVLQVATGAGHTCALLGSGGLKCWGRNESGQLGQGHDSSLSSPPSTTVALDTTAFHLAAGASHTCARMSTGETRCWGRNTWGQLGRGHTYNLGDNEPPTHTPNTTPLAPRLMETYQSSTTTYSGGFVTFRVQGMDPQGSGLSFSWKPELGTLATPTTTEDTSEVVWRAPFECVDGGRPPPRMTATVANALGLSVSHSFTIKGLPPCVFQGPSVLASSTYHSVSVNGNNGSVWAWGSNGSGQLGDETTTQRTYPVQVSGLSLITSVAAGTSHTLALDLDGGIWAWGYNGYGQLGDGTTTRRSIPGHVPWSSGFTAIAAGYNHSVALHHTGTVWSWGENSYGQLGDGTTTSRRTPVQVPYLDGIIAISAHRYSTIALREDGTVWAWGDNNSGQLGDGTTNGRRSPVQVVGLGNVAAVAAGFTHTLALHHDGTLSSWGNNGSGQLGDGTTAHRYVPVQVPDFNGVTTIAAGGFHSVALRQDGTVWTWGLNNYGQLGDGTKTRRVSPQQVPEFDGMTAIAAGLYHTLAQHVYGSRWSWGYNAYGQLGDGTLTQRSSPGPVLDF